jgi:hypothetical protein
MYTIKIRQLLQKAPPTEKAELKGDRRDGAIHSLLNVLRPWGMDSTRNNLYFYMEFMVFHVAVALTIGSTFFIPFGIMSKGLTIITMFFMASAFMIGLRRIHRRFTVEEIRIISTPDDVFAICLMTVFFFVGFFALGMFLIGRPDTSYMWIFFLMTTFFLIYVPFSKISHYVLYPFNRVMYGQIFGGRGVLNKNKPDVTWVPK